MQVTLITPPTEITSESLKQYLADCSAVVRNAQPKDNDRLFNRLMKESFGDRPSRVFEYIPCRVDMATFVVRVQHLNQWFGFFVPEDEAYYTNARELFNAGLTWEEIIPLVDFTHYRAVKVKAPYFLYGQASTHNQITTVSHSNRYTEAGLGHWYPPEFEVAMCNLYGAKIQTPVQDLWEDTVLDTKPKDLQEVMREMLGIKRREVYARGSDMLEYRVYTMGGFLNNPNAWPHFINQRLRDPHTQKEMRELAALIETAVCNT